MADTQALGWTIIGQAETFQTDDAGAFVPGVTVTFQLPGGQTGSVFVPNAKYTVEGVKAAVAARAAAMAAVSQLQG
jgi:hypothetical protein